MRVPFRTRIGSSSSYASCQLKLNFALRTVSSRPFGAMRLKVDTNDSTPETGNSTRYVVERIVLQFGEPHLCPILYRPAGYAANSSSESFAFFFLLLTPVPRLKECKCGARRLRK